MSKYFKQDEIERRCLSAAELRLDGGVKPKITGYAAVFNTVADIGGWFREVIKPGAFAKTIKEADVRALWNHDPNYVLGRNKAGTLRLHEDDKGLAYEIDPVDTTWSKDLIVSMRRGDVNQSSFGFSVEKQDIDYEQNKRTLLEVRLFDVSVVTQPAYETTTAQVRSLFQKVATPKESVKWTEFDSIIAKIKAKADLTEDEYRIMQTYFPTLQMPVRADEVPADNWKRLMVKAQMLQ